MITNIYLSIYFIIILITYYLNKENINLFFLKLLIITFITNDLLRIVTTDLNKNLFIFIFKDIILIILFIIYVISFLKKKKIQFLNKNFIFFLFILILTIILSYNLSFSYNNIAKLISGFYDLFLYPFLILLTTILLQKISDLNKLERELSLVRSRGYARDNEELELGVRCIAAGIYDDQGKLLAGLTISAPADRLDEAWLPKLQSTAEGISQALGYKA